MQNRWSAALKLLGKTARTQIVLSPQTPWTLYNYTYLEDSTAYGAKYWWHDGGQNKSQKTPKTWNTVHYSVSNNQKSSTIPSRKCNNVVGPLLYNSLPKYLRNIKSVQTEKFKFELNKFLELFPDEPKMPNYVTASGSNNIFDHLTHPRAQGIYRSGGVTDSALEQS